MMKKFWIRTVILGLLASFNTYAKTPQLKQKIIKAAQSAGVNQNLSLAIVKVESNFKPNAIVNEPRLKTKSVGLFQILHTSAKGLGFKGTIRQLQNPDVNIKYGIKYLQICTNKHKEKIKNIICCYNCGIGATRCPQNYVNKVMKEYVALNT